VHQLFYKAVPGTAAGALPDPFDTLVSALLAKKTALGLAHLYKMQRANLSTDPLLTNPLNSVAKLARRGGYLKLNLPFVHNFSVKVFDCHHLWKGPFLIYSILIINFL